MQEQTQTDLYLTPKALAHRWNMTPHTLGQWRWKGHGPHFLKLGSRIRYLRDEIEQFEAHISAMTTNEVSDKRFLCIHLGFLPSKEREEITMGS